MIEIFAILCIGPAVPLPPPSKVMMVKTWCFVEQWGLAAARELWRVCLHSGISTQDNPDSRLGRGRERESLARPSRLKGIGIQDKQDSRQLTRQQMGLLFDGETISNFKTILIPT